LASAFSIHDEITVMYSTTVMGTLLGKRMLEREVRRNTDMLVFKNPRSADWLKGSGLYSWQHAHLW
jgi:hypothetical protein